MLKLYGLDEIKKYTKRTSLSLPAHFVGRYAYLLFEHAPACSAIWLMSMSEQQFWRM